MTAEVTESDIDAMIERLRKQQMKYVGGEPWCSKRRQGDDRFRRRDRRGRLRRRQGRKHRAWSWARAACCRELEQGLIGADRRARSATSTVNFPADYRATELAGKAAIFATEIKTVEEPVLPEVDEEFCKAFGVTEGGVAKLREDVAANMRRELEQALRNRNKAAVMEKLYAANPTEVPNVLIEGQIRDMQVEAMRRAGTKDAAQAPPREPFIEPARRRVALGLLLNDVIRKENLVVDRARVNERLDEMVAAYGDAGAMKRAYMQNAEAMRQVESLALEDQAVDWILAHAKVREVKSTFKELMNFEA